MLGSAIWILLAGFLAGNLVRVCGAPTLVGAILIGIIIGPEIGDFISPQVLAAGDELRTVAVMIILMRAGLGLEREKLQQQGNVALRLGFLPALSEAFVIGVVGQFVFNLDFLTSLLLGLILSAESPAVIVPGMLRLKALGWGVNKGIADAILTGSALSDVLVLLAFSLLLTFLTQGTSGELALPLLPIQIIMQVGLGIIFGYLAAQLMSFWLTKLKWAHNLVQEVIITACVALGLVIVAAELPFFSGYLATMSMGFFLSEIDAPLARKLRVGFNKLWIVAETVLFVLLGASIQLQVLENTFLRGLLILFLGLFLGRSLGWYLSTLGSNWNWRERLFLLPGNSAKATVQAAIGAIPLSQGLEGGEIILALAALSILVTAPLGAWAIPTFAPKLLQKGDVDPTKVTISTQTGILAAVDNSPVAKEILLKAATLARQTNGKVIVLHILNREEEENSSLERQTRRFLADIEHQLILSRGNVAEEISKFAHQYQVNYVLMGKKEEQHREGVLLDSLSQKVLASISKPVILVLGQDTAQ